MRRSHPQSSRNDVNIDDACVVWKSVQNLLHTCRKFRSLTHGQMMAILKEHRHCINCLKPGHIVKQHTCGQRLRKCQKPHHSWLHNEKEADKQTKQVSPSNQKPGTVTHHSQFGGCYPVVLTCQVQIVKADGSTTKARALLDSGSSTSLIMESVAKRLRLQLWHPFMKVDGIGGPTTWLFLRGMVHLNISNYRWKTLAVEVVVLPKVTTNLPSCSVPFNCKWKHLLNICLADPNFGTPGSVNLLLLTMAVWPFRITICF